MACIESSKINNFILRKQYLLEKPVDRTLEEVISDIGGLHATSMITPYLSLLARIGHYERSQLEVLLYDQPTLAKIRCVRKTIYIQTKEFLPMMHQATAHMVVKASANFMNYRGVNAATYKSLSSEIVELLKESPQTTAELKEVLGTEVDVSAILYSMCDQGILLRGRPKASWRDKNIHYFLFQEAFPDLDLKQIPEKQAIIELVRYYLKSYGPATEQDLLWWTGLGKIRIWSALNTLGEEVVRRKVCETGSLVLLLAEEEKLLRGTPDDIDVTVNLLPVLDAYLMAYQDRRRFVDDRHYEYVFDRSGNATSTILVNGRVKGIWDFEDGEPPYIKLYSFDYGFPVSVDVLVEQARTLGRFLSGRLPRVKQCTQMIPLTQRTAGSFLSPLKDCK